jgi:glutamine---fructose-6-phosphate transaminase (isomerizing)
MAREIREVPSRIAALIADGRAEIDDVATMIASAGPRWATVAGRGTSDHAATFGRYLFETLLGMPTGLAAPSVTSVYEATLDWTHGLLVAVSQSGQSPDVVAVVRSARVGGAVTIAVTNDVTSPLAEAAHCVIDCRAGPETSVAATKTYVAQLIALAMLVEAVRPDAGLRRALDRLPDQLEVAIERSGEWLESSDVVDRFAEADRTLVVSRGYNLATALEIALKLKEAAGLFADGYSTADLEHGPLALVAADVPVLAVRPPGHMGARVDDVVARLANGGSVPWSIGAGADGTRGRSLGLGLDLPDTLSPAAFVIPGQLLTEAVARRRGLDPDAPRGLAKVTRTT